MSILVILHTLYWQWLSRALDDGWRGWAEHRIAAGWRIETAAPVIGGWPLAAKLHLPRPEVTMPDGSGWSGETASLQIDLLRPGRLLVDASGAQRVTIANGTQVRIPDGRVHLDLPVAGDVMTLFDVAASNVSLPRSMDQPFGPIIGAFSASGHISHFADLPEAPPAAQARSWQQRNGQIELSGFTLRWGTLNVSGSATLALDDRLQPKGDATAHIAGFAEAIGALADAGRLQPQSALLATAALTMLSNGDGIAEVPLELDAGHLTMRQIPLLSVPNVVWPVH